MISENTFNYIRQKHGGYSSWAIWAEASERPKSNMGDMSVLEPTRNSSLYELVNPEVIMVGLNISRSFDEPFRNFHDSNPRANDYKIRFAFRETPYYGAYMTDIIKDFEMVDSGNVKKYIKENPDIIKKNLKIFRDEIQDLNSGNPLILAFGGLVYEILNENLNGNEYIRLVRLRHYSHQIGKEEYRKKVQEEINLT